MTRLRMILNTYNSVLMYKRIPSNNQDKLNDFIENYPNEYAVFKYVQGLRKHV